jgi:hypothetical protein
MALSLNRLAAALGISQKNLGAMSTTRPVDLVSFRISSVAFNPSQKSVNYNENFGFAFNFYAGSNAYLIYQRSQNTSISLDTSYLSVINNSIYNIIYQNQYPVCGGSIIKTATSSFYDQGFYYSSPLYFGAQVVCYGPPIPTVTYVSTSKPPQPCNGNPYLHSGCVGAVITVYFDGGINSTNCNLLINGVLVATFVGNTKGYYTFSGLYGSTIYNISVTNNFGCGSANLQVGTPAYI